MPTNTARTKQLLKTIIRDFHINGQLKMEPNNTAGYYKISKETMETSNLILGIHPNEIDLPQITVGDEGDLEMYWEEDASTLILVINDHTIHMIENAATADSTTKELMVGELKFVDNPITQALYNWHNA